MRSLSSRLLSWPHSMRRSSEPVQPEAVMAASGNAVVEPRRTRSASDRICGTMVPAPRPSWRQATVASAAPKRPPQTWLQEPSKKTWRRPVAQLAMAASSTSLRSPSSAWQ